MSTAVIIVAAGRGTRAGGEIPKQWQRLGSVRVIDHTLNAFRRAGLGPVVVVVHPDDMSRLADQDVILCGGGETRADSVRAGLEALVPFAPRKVLIHDAARPCVSASVIDGVIAALDQHQAAAPAVAVVDALWRGAAHVSDTAERSGLWRAQTPQGFAFDTILAAHRALPAGHAAAAADDVAVARAFGVTVAITAGEEDNLKITTPADFARAARILGTTLDIRTGNGYDVHRFGEGESVWLCGVEIPHSHGLVGHSDADVGMHAVTDAIYGALARGDIGQHFPPSDPQWKGARSDIFLRHAVELARSMGFTITHADCTLVCEMPKIGPHASAMRAEMARIMGLDIDRVSVKATTSEELGFTGRREGIAALATATLVKL